MTADHSSAEPFVRGNDRLNRALADPETARRVAVIRAGMDAADAEYRNHLATIRKAAHLTQVAIAERMGIKQAAVSSLERRDDMLLSTLANYLTAAGASNIRVSLTLDGQDIDYPVTTTSDSTT